MRDEAAKLFAAVREQQPPPMKSQELVAHVHRAALEAANRAIADASTPRETIAAVQAAASALRAIDVDDLPNDVAPRERPVIQVIEAQLDDEPESERTNGSAPASTH
jgi:putative N-acetylmannosamine-6-phosphate epimerase